MKKVLDILLKKKIIEKKEIILSNWLRTLIPNNLSCFIVFIVPMVLSGIPPYGNLFYTLLIPFLFSSLITLVIFNNNPKPLELRPCTIVYIKKDRTRV